MGAIMPQQRVVTFYIRVREHLVPVTVKTRVPANHDWLMRLQSLAGQLAWAHEPEFIAQLARDGLDMGIINPGDI